MASSDLKRKAITENLEQAQSGSDVEAVSEPLLGNGRTKGSKNLRCKLDDARARECLMEEYGRNLLPTMRVRLLLSLRLTRATGAYL